MTSPAPLSLLATTSQQPVTVVTKNQPAAAITASQLLAAAEATTAASRLHPVTMAHQPEGLTPQDRGHQAGATMVATMDEKDTQPKGVDYKLVVVPAHVTSNLRSSVLWKDCDQIYKNFALKKKMFCF